MIHLSPSSNIFKPLGLLFSLNLFLLLFSNASSVENIHRYKLFIYLNFSFIPIFKVYLLFHFIFEEK